MKPLVLHNTHPLVLETEHEICIMILVDNTYSIALQYRVTVIAYNREYLAGLSGFKSRSPCLTLWWHCRGPKSCAVSVGITPFHRAVGNVGKRAGMSKTTEFNIEAMFPVIMKFHCGKYLKEFAAHLLTWEKRISALKPSKIKNDVEKDTRDG